MSAPGYLSRLLFPPKCLLCRRILEKEETDLCHACRADCHNCGGDRRKFPFLDSWTAIWYYEGRVRASILRYKFHGARGYAAGYARLLAMRLEQAHPEGFDLITFVPTSRLRRLRRGYDQVALLADALGRELGQKPVRLLKKVRNNPPQSGISGQAERRANVLNAYRLPHPEAVVGKRVLLLDDIVTTGATAGECARLLLTAGAKQVHLGVIAAAPGKGKQSR